MRWLRETWSLRRQRRSNKHANTGSSWRKGWPGSSPQQPTRRWKLGGGQEEERLGVRPAQIWRQPRLRPGRRVQIGPELVPVFEPDSPAVEQAVAAMRRQAEERELALGRFNSPPRIPPVRRRLYGGGDPMGSPQVASPEMSGDGSNASLNSTPLAPQDTPPPLYRQEEEEAADELDGSFAYAQRGLEFPSPPPPPDNPPPQAPMGIWRDGAFRRGERFQL